MAKSSGGTRVSANKNIAGSKPVDVDKIKFNKSSLTTAKITSAKLGRKFSEQIESAYKIGEYFAKVDLKSGQKPYWNIPDFDTIQAKINDEWGQFKIEKGMEPLVKALNDRINYLERKYKDLIGE